MYELESENLYNSNILKHTNKISDKWWNSVDIKPIDFLINKIKNYAYVHHIERLMFLSNWLLLNKIDPKEVYKIFMEWTIDAYEWVMIPNVFGMGQYASNSMMTRLYFSSSNYILKMSDYKKSDWCEIWDALYYRFIHKNHDMLKKIYATARNVYHWDNKSKSEQDTLLNTANKYLKFLD
jgi:deoxyribodipyrimidine photolyase-related protein